MATRRSKKHQEDVRAKIQTAKLVQILTDHANGTRVIADSSRVKAAEILLKKAMPDLSAVEMTQTEELPSEQELSNRIMQLVRLLPIAQKVQLSAALNAELAQTAATPIKSVA